MDAKAAAAGGATNIGGGGGGGGGRGYGGGEVRRIHIVYYLSRKGRIEDPHLIRVHQFSCNGVRLRDVKRWLSELRGKDMPESYCWSYLRKYKAIDVWQDLLDDDLITPISDNEYVLKGSEIPSISLDNPSLGEKKFVASMQKDGRRSRQETEKSQETTIGVSTKASSEIKEEESPLFGSEASTLTDYSTKIEEEDRRKQEEGDKKEKSSSFYSLFFKNNKKSKSRSVDIDSSAENTSTVPATSSTCSSEFAESKSYSSGASNKFISFISCKAVDCNDTVMVRIRRREKSSCEKPVQKSDYSSPEITKEICKGDKLGGSDRIFGASSWDQQIPHSTYAARRSVDGGQVRSSNDINAKSEFNNQNQKPVPAAYKPVNGPSCSQCGKMFKPEKMHAHMKSCRGMKSLAKGAACGSTCAFEPRKSMDSPYPETLLSGYYLTNST